MSKVMINNGDLQDIADAIRGKNGSTDTYKPYQMASAIEAIPAGGGEPDTETYMRLLDLACFSPRRYSEKDYTAEEVSKVEELLNKGVSV